MLLAEISPAVGGLGAFTVLALIIDLWALFDLLKRPSWAFEAAHVHRVLWIVLLAVSWLACGIGFFVALFYLLMVSPQVRSQQKLGRGPGFPGRAR